MTNKRDRTLTLTWKAAAFAIVAILVAPAFHAQQSLPPLQPTPPPLSPWQALPAPDQNAILDNVRQALAALPTPLLDAFQDTTGLDSTGILALVPGLFDRLQSESQTVDADSMLHVAQGIAYGLLAPLGQNGLPGLASPSTLNSVPGTGDCNWVGTPDGVIGPLVNAVICAVFDIVGIGTVAVGIVVAVVLFAAVIGYGAVTELVLQPDDDLDRIGNEYEKIWGALQSPDDLDSDGLSNLREFQWDLSPFDPDYGDDNWIDGPEVDYWNDPSNDDIVSVGNGVAFFDQDRLVDTDGDGSRNVDDADSDNDGVLDGNEITRDSYPEFADSDCILSASQCTASSSSTFIDDSRAGNPGAGDGLEDGPELSSWNALGAGKWNTDFDGDAIASNLLDPDSDSDGLLDGQEFTTGQVRPDIVDTDGDGVDDGDEPGWNVDYDCDGRVNANDSDSDDDGIQDGSDPPTLKDPEECSYGGGPNFHIVANGPPVLTVGPGWTCEDYTPSTFGSNPHGNWEISCTPPDGFDMCLNPTLANYLYSGAGSATGTVTCGSLTASCTTNIGISSPGSVQTCITMAMGESTVPLRCRIEVSNVGSPWFLGDLQCTNTAR
jgi:hypothetical protein